ncbi:MAG: type I-U CRISPR-associated protein Cas5/Cas6, partial [Planctomycetaceae bacterium]|nr:type I-U CRISPR-associated protein Cas5/Cas6 [Planctomycetaceae bacterium]
MPFLKLSVELLDQTYHGCGDGGSPEWPPSPLRVFQSLVASAARGQMIGEDWERALNWLAAQSPPTIVAPPHRVGTPYRASVPNNAMDIVAKAWSRGNETGKDAQPSTHKAMKTIRPTYLPEGSRVFYLWLLDREPATEVLGHIERLRILARQLVALGWGLDLVVGNLEVISDDAIDQLSGERWIPSTANTHLLRVPHAHTLAALQNRHAQFERRFQGGALTPVPQLSPAAFRRISYRRDWEPEPRPVAAFRLLQLDGERFRIFSTRRACAVAGMLRHITATTAQETGWSEDRVGTFILGHGESRDDSSHQPVGRERFAFVPLPSLEKRQKEGSAHVVGPIRRALVFVPEGGATDAIEWAKRNL